VYACADLVHDACGLVAWDYREPVEVGPRLVEGKAAVLQEEVRSTDSACFDPDSDFARSRGRNFALDKS
jgi:hypothetical protein